MPYGEQMNDQEREAHIVDCGTLMLKAMEEGDRTGAKRWLKLQNEAVLGRSPAQVAKLEACYFASDGDKARQAAQGATDGR
jgi:hypothetical protein